MSKTLITYRPETISQDLLGAMQSVSESDNMIQFTVHVGDTDGDKSVREALRQLTPQRTEMLLDMALNSRTYHNGTKVLEVVLEDYVLRNGWRRDYVDIATWQSDELRFAGLNAS